MVRSFSSHALSLTAATGSDDLLSTNPKTKEEFEAYANKLADHLYNRHGSKAFYAEFIENFAKALCTPLKDLEVRKASSALATLANEKQRTAREAGGKKKKGAAKPGLGLAKAGTGYDTRMYDESLVRPVIVLGHDEMTAPAG